MRLELLQVSDQESTFLRRTGVIGETFEWIVARFIIDPKRIVMANDDGWAGLRLGKYSLLRSETNTFSSRHQSITSSLIVELS